MCMCKLTIKNICAFLLVIIVSVSVKDDCFAIGLRDDSSCLNSVYVGSELKRTAMKIPSEFQETPYGRIVRDNVKFYIGLSGLSNHMLEIGTNVRYPSIHGNSGLFISNHYITLMKGYQINDKCNLFVGGGLSISAKDDLYLARKVIPRILCGTIVNIYGSFYFRTSITWDNLSRVNYTGKPYIKLNDCISTSLGILYNFDL